MKKKALLFVLPGILVLPYLAPGSGSAESPVDIYLDGQILSFNQSPFSKEGTALAPVHPFAESLGFRVSWEEESGTIVCSRAGAVIRFPLEENTATVNGELYRLPVGATGVNGTGYVPVKFLAEASGARVKWYSPLHSIGIFVGKEWREMI